MPAHQETCSIPAPCPICQGAGEVTCVDEEVGCQVRIPCWACAGTAESSPGHPLPDAPWLA